MQKKRKPWEPYPNGFGQKVVYYVIIGVVMLLHLAGELWESWMTYVDNIGFENEKHRTRHD